MDHPAFLGAEVRFLLGLGHLSSQKYMDTCSNYHPRSWTDKKLKIEGTKLCRRRGRIQARRELIGEYIYVQEKEAALFDLILNTLCIITSNRLKADIRVDSHGLTWFDSFLKNRTQRVKLGSFFYPVEKVEWGVPQGSPLSPLLFNIYVRPLLAILKEYNISYESYADDTQILLRVSKSADNYKLTQEGLNKARNWLAHNHLKLNPTKTELIAPHKTPEAAAPSIFGENVVIATQGKSLGIILDQEMSLCPQIKEVIRKANFALFLLKKALPFLPNTCRQVVVGALVNSHLDYGNAMYAGLPEKDLGALQHCQNRAIRLIKKLDWTDSVTKAPLHLQVGSLREDIVLIRHVVHKINQRTLEVEKRVSVLEDDTKPLKMAAKRAAGDVASLFAKTDDLENRSRRNNIRIVGIPEETEGTNATEFIEKWLFQLFQDKGLSALYAVERAHRVPTRPLPPGRPPRPILAKMDNVDMVLNGSKISIFPDYSAEVQKKQTRCRELKDSFSSSSFPGWDFIRMRFLSFLLTQKFS
ncbi:uncharacterized protein LOC122922511 [Bufo gargarizans]|uniref:uncharacterized protein LOC122922511 n=1 Tax=Bufo gargarizans TaxID=30331 RepID=UPI001CF1B767|nr:uncharacterized protein LOC122922511 [Bufo gargarizans]